jgi:hypothetical protein
VKVRAPGHGGFAQSSSTEVRPIRSITRDAAWLCHSESETYLRDGLDGLDAILFAAERGSAWTLLYPAYSIAVPRPVVRLPLAIPVADGDPALTEYLNAWLSVRKEDRTIQRLYDYWVLGREEKPRKHRWSVIRDVLGWVE